jgi:hypothetical protein
MLLKSQNSEYRYGRVLGVQTVRSYAKASTSNVAVCLRPAVRCCYVLTVIALESISPHFRTTSSSSKYPPGCFRNHT